MWSPSAQIVNFVVDNDPVIAFTVVLFHLIEAIIVRFLHSEERKTKTPSQDVEHRFWSYTSLHSWRSCWRARSIFLAAKRRQSRESERHNRESLGRGDLSPRAFSNSRFILLQSLLRRLKLYLFHNRPINSQNTRVALWHNRSTRTKPFNKWITYLDIAAFYGMFISSLSCKPNSFPYERLCTWTQRQKATRKWPIEPFTDDVISWCPAYNWLRNRSVTRTCGGLDVFMIWGFE